MSSEKSENSEDVKSQSANRSRARYRGCATLIFLFFIGAVVFVFLFGVMISSCGKD
jgi:hypothetical protein